MGELHHVLVRMSRVALVAPVLLLCGCGFVGFSVPRQDDRTPLVKAAQAGDLAEVKRLLAAGADPNEGANGFTPLYASVISNQVAVMQTLLAGGADPNGRRPEGAECWTLPVIVAASTDEESAAKTRMLLAAGANPNAGNGCSQVRLGYLRSGVARVLVGAGIDAKRVDSDGRNELHLALHPPDVPYPGTVEYLIGLGVPVNARDKAGKTPLAYWREPRFFENESTFEWLLSTVFGEAEYKKERRARQTRVSAILTRAGATL